MRGADLKSANLTGADLERSDMRRASLRWADLQGADLAGAKLEGVKLEGVKLEGADLKGTILELPEMGVATNELDFSDMPSNVLVSDSVLRHKTKIEIEEVISKLSCLIRKKREELGMTQKELARKSGVSHSVVTNYETGKSGMSISKIFLLLSALGCNVKLNVHDK